MAQIEEEPRQMYGKLHGFIVAAASAQAVEKFVLPHIDPFALGTGQWYILIHHIQFKGTTTKKWNRGRSGLQWIWDQSRMLTTHWHI
ncbi:hypothetical protein ACHAWO_008806 [Cyclotella atomus]|uniref:Uncharacterized protein n=1 Tax=Cyclotella atomus TaxID=382360 RepID=A0ABD3NE70_9STRA